MALNPQYEAIGKAFTQQYYALFDDAAQRPQLVNLYNAEQSLMTFEGQQMQGTIMSDDHNSNHIYFESVPFLSVN